MDYNGRPFVDQIEQLNHVGVAHANATVTVWGADPVFVFGAVNINEPIARIGILFLQAIKPNDTRGN